MVNNQGKQKWNKQGRVKYLTDEIKRVEEAINDAETRKTILETEPKLAKNGEKIAELTMAIMMGKLLGESLQKRLSIEK